MTFYVRLGGILVKIRTDHLLNKNLERHRCANQLGTQLLWGETNETEKGGRITLRWISDTSVLRMGGS
jgi:hypothetical protein